MIIFPLRKFAGLIAFALLMLQPGCNRAAAGELYFLDKAGGMPFSECRHFLDQAVALGSFMEKKPATATIEKPDHVEFRVCLFLKDTVISCKGDPARLEMQQTGIDCKQAAYRELEKALENLDEQYPKN